MEEISGGVGLPHINPETWAETKKKKCSNSLLVLQNRLSHWDILLMSVLHRKETNKGCSQECHFCLSCTNLLKKMYNELINAKQNYFGKREELESIAPLQPLNVLRLVLLEHLGCGMSAFESCCCTDVAWQTLYHTQAMYVVCINALTTMWLTRGAGSGVFISLSLTVPPKTLNELYESVKTGFAWSSYYLFCLTCLGFGFDFNSYSCFSVACRSCLETISRQLTHPGHTAPHMQAER